MQKKDKKQKLSEFGPCVERVTCNVTLPSCVKPVFYTLGMMKPLYVGIRISF